jgi:signal transduction histidine kinase
MASTLTDRPRQWLRLHWAEALWAVFVAANTIGILTFGEWATVPFHFIWIGLSLMYGWRVWSTRATGWALASVIVLTGGAMFEEVRLGQQALDELTEIPLMSIVFLVMVWYVRRAVGARELFRRVSEHNMALLRQQRLLVQDASHVLRTPLTIALGHAELFRRTTSDTERASDLDVVIDELKHLKHISDRLLALAALDQPDFLRPVRSRMDDLVIQVWSRWSTTHPEILLGDMVTLEVPHDDLQVREALDELITNAVRHCPPGTKVTVAMSVVDGGVRISVADRGLGIPEDDRSRIFDRFAQAEGSTSRRGVGLGLAFVRAIADAHGGRVSLSHTAGGGSTFALWLPGHAVRATVANDEAPAEPEATAVVAARVQ